MFRMLKETYKACHRVLGYCPTTVDGLRFRCDADHVHFWRTLSKGGWETETYKIFTRFLTPDTIYCDIGAWIGPTVIYAAKKCKRVYCFEPDRFAYEYLLQNIRLNTLSNVLPFYVALTDRDGIGKMASFGVGLGDSMTSLLKADREDRTTNVMCMKWDTWLDLVQPADIGFMKIDTEGGEFSLLPTLRGYLTAQKPMVYLSTHAHFLAEDRRKEEMYRVQEIMKIYGKCMNEKMEIVPRDELIADTTLNRSRSFLFMD